MRPPNLESLPSPCDYILQTWLLPRGRNAASYVRVGFRCQFSRRLNLYLGLNMQAVGQKPHPPLMLLPPRGVRRTGLSFPFLLLLIPWLLTPLRSGLQAFGGSLAFTVWLCSQLSSSLAARLSQALQRLIPKYSQKSAVVTPCCCTCSFPMCKHYQIFLPVATATRRKLIQRQVANCTWSGLWKPSRPARRKDEGVAIKKKILVKE